jgi:hypothetical protein
VAIASPALDRRPAMEADEPTVAPAVHQDAARRRWTPVRRVQAIAGLFVTLAVCLQTPSTTDFRGDASVYWGATMAILQGGDLFTVGVLRLRGIATTVLYLPAGLVVTMTGGAGAAFAVLLENAFLVAAIGAFLLPRFVGLWRPVTPRVVWVCAVSSTLLLRGFATIPLTDLWAGALLLLAVVALRKSRWLPLMVSGAAAGLAFNVRPAMLFPIVGITVVVLLFRRISGLWFLGGAAVALLPQSLYNLSRGGSPLPWPEETFALSGMQARDASFTVRYDTLDTDSGLAPFYYCSPSMAHIVDGKLPSSGGELAALFVAHPVEAAVFSAQKIAAALHWGLAVPFGSPTHGVDGLFAVLVTATTVVGAATLLGLLFRSGWRAITLPQTAAVLFWLGTAASLITSATEIRFAMGLVLVGIGGCAVLAAGEGRVPRTRAGRLRLAAVVVAVLAVFALGVSGLQHPFNGYPKVTDCASV